MESCSPNSPISSLQCLFSSDLMCAGRGFSPGGATESQFYSGGFFWLRRDPSLEPSKLDFCPFFGASCINKESLLVARIGIAHVPNLYAARRPSMTIIPELVRS